MKTEVLTKGHLSAKLVIKDLHGNESWQDYDTRTATGDPVRGTIMVFNSVIGQYEACTSLEDARNKFIDHTRRLTYITEDQQVLLTKRRKELKARGKRLRNIHPFMIAPGG